MYKHLSREERYQIYSLRLAKQTISEIARLLGRHRSTISRELGRGRGLRGYRAEQACSKASERAKKSRNARRVDAKVWADVSFYLGLQWSPEQIAGYLKINAQPTVSHESIYQRIYADKAAGGTLHLALRCQKPRRKRYGSGQERRGTIPNQVSIDKRPTLVNQRERFGDWEGDLVIGSGQHQALVTLNERTTRYSLIAHVPFKTAQAVSDAMISLLAPFAANVHTLTTDNGKEFAQHEHIAKQLGANFYFAHPYASWERGANENMNGLIRQFFPKKMPFDDITVQDISFVTNRLNHRPRKCLGYKTPHEVFMKQLQSCHTAVALQA